MEDGSYGKNTTAAGRGGYSPQIMEENEAGYWTRDPFAESLRTEAPPPRGYERHCWSFGRLQQNHDQYGW